MILETIAIALLFLSGKNKLIAPLKGRITQDFSSTHNGIDIAVPIGTAIKAPKRGFVVVQGWDNNFGGGNTILLQHDKGERTGYAHLTKIIVKAGQKVQQGEIIGYSGNTGVSTGPHLHFTYQLNGVNVNPRKYYTFE